MRRYRQISSALLLPRQTEVESLLRVVGDGLATATYLWLPCLIGFERDDAGKVAWLPFLGRLVPQTRYLHSVPTYLPSRSVR